MAKKFNKSTDNLAIDNSIKDKIVNYAKKRIKQSGATPLGKYDGDILEFDYPSEGFISFYSTAGFSAEEDEVFEDLEQAITDIANFIVKQGFTMDDESDGEPYLFISDNYSEDEDKYNEATEVPDGRMTVELDDTDVVEGDTLLLAELTDDVFNAINAVIDELDPEADLEITQDSEELLQIAVVTDEDLDDDAFDEIMSEMLEDIDLEDIVADMTDSVEIDDPDDEDYGRVVQFINFYKRNGVTVVPNNSVIDDILSGTSEGSINESVNYISKYSKNMISNEDQVRLEKFAKSMEEGLRQYLCKAKGLPKDTKLKGEFYSLADIQKGVNGKYVVLTVKYKKPVENDILAKNKEYYIPLKGVSPKDLGDTRNKADLSIENHYLICFVSTDIKLLSKSNESTKTPTLPTQSELKALVQKSMIKFGDRNAKVTVHAYRTGKYEDGVVDVDLDNTSLATDGTEDDYYDEDNVKNALKYAADELINEYGQHKKVLDSIGIEYNKVGSLTITFSLDSELNESFEYEKVSNDLETELNSEQPLVDPYDIRCTIRPVFVRKGQFLFDGDTIYKSTSDAKTNKESGISEFKVDVLLSNDPDILDSSKELSLPVNYDGLKLLRGNPVKNYNESKSIEFVSEEEAREYLEEWDMTSLGGRSTSYGYLADLDKSDYNEITEYSKSNLGDMANYLKGKLSSAVKAYKITSKVVDSDVEIVLLSDDPLKLNEISSLIKNLLKNKAYGYSIETSVSVYQEEVNITSVTIRNIKLLKGSF